MSTLQQTRVNVHDVVRQLVSSHDLTPASEGEGEEGYYYKCSDKDNVSYYLSMCMTLCAFVDDGDSNLKLYLDKQGKVTLAGHDLDR